MAPGPGRRAGQPPVPLTVLCGFDRHAVADTAAALLLAGSRLAAVWADPFTAELGYVQTRVTDSDGRYADQAFAVQEGCLPSTVRAATVHAVRRLHRTGRHGTTASDDTAPGSGRPAPGVPGAPGSRTETA